MKRVATVLLGSALVFAVCGTSSAQEFQLGEESKGVTVKAAENTDLTVRVRLQPRLDVGDIIKSKDGKSYDADQDMYLRRIRLELEGNLYKNLKYSLVLDGDRANQIGKANTFSTQYAYLDYKFDDEFNMRFGKAKLPISRIALTSSSKQLIVERPVSVEDAKKLFGDYYQPNLLFHGKISDGALAYQFAIADGVENGTVLYSSGLDNTVHKGNPLYIGRIEMSPPGWIEKSKSDAHLGKGQHITLGANIAVQNKIEYQGATNTYDEDRTLWSADISGHFMGLTAQAEYIAWKIDSSSPSRGTVEPKGWYAQAGYFIPGINIEPTVRYEIYEQDSKKDDTRQKVATGGLNWYLKGHSMKIGANYVSTKFDKNAKGFLANADKTNVFQLQAQLYF
jgi:phosphate-selective porin